MTDKQKQYVRKLSSYGEVQHFSYVLEQLREFAIILAHLVDAYEKSELEKTDLQLQNLNHLSVLTKNLKSDESNANRSNDRSSFNDKTA